MNIITQLLILTLSLLLVNADQYCDNLIKQYHNIRTQCSPENITTINTCCDLTAFMPNKAPSAVYQIKKCATACKDQTFTIVTATANVYCDMITDGGGWIVIQRNKKDSTLSFNKKWAEYEEGFGDLEQEFWYGLKALHCLTKSGQWEIRVDYQNNDKTWSYLHYNQFSVGSASEEYPLTIGGFTGVDTAFAYHSGNKFSTPDNDNDNHSTNCAAGDKSGWWYNACRYINTNTQPPNVRGSVLAAEMKIRPKDCI